MHFKPSGLVRRYCSTAQNEFHSQYQFDHTARNLRGWITKANPVSDIEAALWLSSLLAHWGMFRGSGTLRDKNTLFFQALLKFAAIGKQAALRPLIGLPFERLTTISVGSLDESFHKLDQWLENEGVAATDTLMTKIALGLTCNVPAYDRNFKRGLQVLAQNGKYQGVQSFGGRGLHDLVGWAAEYHWPKVRSQSDRRQYLPLARVVDIAVFQFGIENPRSDEVG